MSLRRYIVEEGYELIQAIEDGNVPNMCEECGDLMLQVVFVSCMAEERGDFTVCDVLDGLTNKLIRRHPHVFGDVHVNDSDDVLKNWEQIKSAERKKKEEDSSYMAGIPRGMPALLRAYRIQERAAKARLSTGPRATARPVMAKVEEEVAELKEAAASGDRAKIEEELGDLLFASVNLSRHLGADPEITLQPRMREIRPRASGKWKSPLRNRAVRGRTSLSTNLKNSGRKAKNQ